MSLSFGWMSRVAGLCALGGLTGCFDPIEVDTDSGSEGSGSTGSGPGSQTISSTLATSNDSTVGDASASGDTGSSSVASLDDGPGSTGSTGTPSTDGTDDTDGTSTGEPACPPTGPAGLPGVNPGHIWIANSTQSTISKVDTVALTEVGRFLTRQDAAGSPSRTSVGLDGDIAVANRNGGLTKFYGDPADCSDVNGDGMVTTSANNVALPWDDEECRAWHIPMVYTSQRPVAWTTGEPSPDGCSNDEERIWTAGVIANNTIEVVLVDGEAGVVLDSVQMPEIAANFYGLYGGAVDVNGDFWASQLGIGSLVHVDLDDLSYETWPMPTGGYGITVGPSGYVFTCSNDVARFDPATEQWATATVGGGGGCNEDGQGRLWMASSPLIAVNVQTLQVEESIPLPEYVHGVGIDFQGNVWGVSMSTNAFRVDPADGTFDTVTGFVSPYTYSDMTGFALASVAAP